MLGRFIGSLYNRYITAEDVGATVDDIDHIFQETDRVVGVHEVQGGSASNQLDSEAGGTVLEERGILYAPDYAINADGLINVTIELQGYDKGRAHRQVSLIYNNLGRRFDIAERDGIPSWRAADRMAEERIAAVGRTRLPYTRRFKDRLSGRAHHTTTTH